MGESNGNGAFDHVKVDRWFAWMEKHQLSWANWSVSDKKETTAILLPGASPNGNWSMAELSPAGLYIRAQLRRLSLK